MNDDLDAYLDPVSTDPRKRVHTIAARIGITPDVADDYLRTTQVESGNNINVRNSSKGAIGFGQVMPDVKGGTTRTINGRSFNLKDPDQNIEAGLRYFAEGGNDPVGRRLYYFGGPKAKLSYERTGRIPNISDRNMSASQYVRATGATPRQQQGELDRYLDPVSGQNPPPQRQNRVNPPSISATQSPVDSRQPSVPIEQALQRLNQQIEGTMKKRGIYSRPKPQPSAPEIIDAGNAEPARIRESNQPAMSARTPSAWERFKETVEPYVPGLSTLDTAFGVKTDPLRGAVSGLTLGAVGDPRQVSQEEKIVDPEAQAKADLAHQVGSFAPAVVPYMGAAKALEFVPLLNRAGRVASIARTAATFGGVELGREAIHAAKTDTPLDPKEVAISTAIGASIGTLSGVNPSLKRQVIAFVTPQAVADVARGTDPTTAVTNAFTNLLFGLHAGGRVNESALAKRLTDLKAHEESLPQSARAFRRGNVAQNEAQPNVTAQPETIESTPLTTGQGRGDISAEPIDRRGSESPLGTQIRGTEGTGVAPRRWQHVDFGEVVESPDQRRLGKGRVRVTAEDGSEHVIKRAALTGAGNQRAIPIREQLAAQTPRVDPELLRRNPEVEQQIDEGIGKLREGVQSRDVQDLGDVDAVTVKPDIEQYLDKPVEQEKPEPSTPVSEVPKPVESTEPISVQRPRLKDKTSRLATGERSDISLSQFVRKAGGIFPSEMHKGELDRLRLKESGTTGLINQNARQGRVKQTADIVMQMANDAGFRDKDGQPFTNPGDFLYAVERDVAGERVRALTGDELDWDKEYQKYLQSPEIQEKERAFENFSQEPNIRDSYEKLLYNGLESLTPRELTDLRKAAEKHGIADEIEYSIESAQRLGDAAEPTEADTSFEFGERSTQRTIPSERVSRPATQLGFTEEGLTQQEGRLPPKLPDQRARLIEEEKARQETRDPERAAALRTLENLRAKGMSIDDYARQGSLTGESPSPEKIAYLKRIAGQRGAVNISPEKAEYQPATTPILKDVERATMDAENKRPSLGQYGRRTKSYIQRALISEFTPLRELEQTLTGKENVPVVNMARKFEQVAGAPAKAQADIFDFKKNVIEPVKRSADDFNSYLFLKRVQDRLSKEPERKRVSDWTPEKAQQGLDELKAKVGSDTYQKLEQAGSAYQNEMDKALRLQVESGRMSEDLYKAIKESNDFYAPFKVLRHIEDTDLVRGSGRRVATTQDLTKKITGIDSEDFKLGNILQASAEQIVRSRILAEKNLKMLELDKLADLDPKGDLIRRVEGDERPRQGYEYVRFLKNGEPVALEVEHKVADAVQGLNPKQTGLLAKVAMKFGGILRTGATSANAAFQMRNLLFADLPRAALVSRYGARGVKDLYQFPLDWTQSLMSSFKGNFNKPDQLYMDFLRSGAANSTIQRDLTPEAFRPTLGIAKPGVKHLAKSVLDTVPKISNAIEETSKILGVKRGMRIENLEKTSPAERQATMEKIAAEVRNYSGSPDFARKGSETRDLNLLFMFFNARLQGVTSDLSRLAGRTGKREAAAAWIRLGATIGLGSTILALMNKQPENKDDYDKIPDWEKQNYWMIPRSTYFKNEEGETVRDYWRIPKRELGQIFGNTVESAVNFAFQRDPKEAKHWATDLLENISPINIQGETLGERMESSFSSTNPAVKLPAEAIMNRDTFRHRDIVPEYMKKVKPSEQYRESTPKIYRKAGQAFNVSPLRLEHLTEGITGSAANQFTTRPQTEGRSALSRYPITRTFTRSEQVAKDRSQSQAEEDLATKQLLRRRERDEALRRFRAGEITKDEFDRLESEGRITKSDVKRLNKESGMSSQQVSFMNLIPSQALDRYERMGESQREGVKEIMQRKAHTLLNSTALTDEQKEQFKKRIESLGIEPIDAKRKKGFSTSTKGFKTRFSNYLNQ